MSKSKKVLTVASVIFLLLSVNYANGKLFNTQIIDDQEGIVMKLNSGLNKDSLSNQKVITTEYTWYYNTIGSFLLFITVTIYGVFAYKIVIKNEKVSLFGKSYKKKKEGKFKYYV